MLDVLGKAERRAFGVYTALGKYTAGKEHCTYDLALAIRHEEVEHEAWFSDFMSCIPSRRHFPLFPSSSKIPFLKFGQP
jgi:ferritin-like protein